LTRGYVTDADLAMPEWSSGIAQVSNITARAAIGVAIQQPFDGGEDASLDQCPRLLHLLDKPGW